MDDVRTGSDPTQLRYDVSKTAMIEAARLQNGIAIAAWPAAVMFAVMAFT
jgi:hypothetical protein